MEIRKLKSIIFNCQEGASFESADFSYFGEQEVTIDFETGCVKQAFIYSEYCNGNRPAFCIEGVLGVEQLKKVEKCIDNILFVNESFSESTEFEECWCAELTFINGQVVVYKGQDITPEGGRFVEKLINNLVAFPYPVILFGGNVPSDESQIWLEDNYKKIVENSDDLRIRRLNPFAQIVAEKGTMVAVADLLSDIDDAGLFLINGSANEDNNLGILFNLFMELLDVGGIDPFEWSYQHGVNYGRKAFFFGVEEKTQSVAAVLDFIREVLIYMANCRFLTEEQSRNIFCGIYWGYSQQMTDDEQTMPPLIRRQVLFQGNIVSFRPRTV